MSTNVLKKCVYLDSSQRCLKYLSDSGIDISFFPLMHDFGIPFYNLYFGQ